MLRSSSHHFRDGLLLIESWNSRDYPEFRQVCIPAMEPIRIGDLREGLRFAVNSPLQGAHQVLEALASGLKGDVDCHRVKDYIEGELTPAYSWEFELSIC